MCRVRLAYGGQGDAGGVGTSVWCLEGVGGMEGRARWLVCRGKGEKRTDGGNMGQVFERAAMCAKSTGQNILNILVFSRPLYLFSFERSPQIGTVAISEPS